MSVRVSVLALTCAALSAPLGRSGAATSPTCNRTNVTAHACCGGNGTQTIASFDCNTTAACCAACLDDLACTTWHFNTTEAARPTWGVHY